MLRKQPRDVNFLTLFFKQASKNPLEVFFHLVMTIIKIKSIVTSFSSTE